MKGEIVGDQFVTSRKPKSREVSSRFQLSPNPENAMQSPKPTLSPQRQKQRSSTKKHKSLETSGFMSGLWPSTTPTNSTLDTLNDHLKHDRNIDHNGVENHEKTKNHLFLSRQRSCTEFQRVENEKESGFKENHRPSFGSSMRYAAGKLKFSGKSKTPSSKLFNSNDGHDHDSSSNNIHPGRFSVDEDSLRRKSFGRKSYTSSLDDSESGNSDLFSGSSFASYMASTASSRQYGIEVSSKYSPDLSSRSRRWSADSISQKPSSADTSPHNFKLKNEIKKAKSFSKFGFSPGRSSSPVFGEDKAKLISSTDSKPPSSPSRGKGVGSFISIGLVLFKGRKSLSNGSSYLCPGAAEDVHQLKLLHNSLMKWRYCNAKSQAVNSSVHQQVERNLTCGLICIGQMQQSVQKKKIVLDKEKLKMKLRQIIYSQIKLLEAWGNMERQYQSALSETIDHLHFSVCEIPLVDGAKAEPHSTSIVMRCASDLGSSIKSIVSTFSSTAEDSVLKMAELAELVTQEMSMLEECLELFKTISNLEIQERSLKCTAMLGKMLLKQQQLIAET